ncbi:MAG: MBOAT family protein [Myxococcales bacterium]|nr:MBOAT family protein [Myxococcales bacterium]
MYFNSLQYLLFTAVVVSTYWMLVELRMLRLFVLLCASWVFYMSWSPLFILLIIGSTFLDYAAGLAIYRAERPGIRKLFLMVSMVGNLGLLGIFKYYDFFAGAIADSFRLLAAALLEWPGIAWSPLTTAADQIPFLNLVLPVGISFYTFQTMSYTIDIYRRQLEPTRSFLQFATFVAFFPQLVAGPIVRASEFLPQLRHRPRIDMEKVGHGLFLILAGLVKKVVFADYLAINLVDRVFDRPDAFTSVEVLVALYGYTVQIYCDFSGYSDVAIGTGLLMGLRLPDNFDRPYQSTNPAEFWRRWHMTLSSWLRDYLYFPLGGSRRGPIRSYVNLFLTLFLIGLWHGAAWTFVLYGTIHATAMVFHRFWVRLRKQDVDRVDSQAIFVFKVALMFHFTVLSRILFRAKDLDNASAVADQLLLGTTSVAQVAPTVWLAIGLAMAIHWTPKRWVVQVKEAFTALPALVQGVIMAAVGALLVEVATSDVVPYIYFQF